MVGKMLNAGQVCIAPDYLMVPEENIEEVISLAKDAVEAMYPSLLDNDQYTAMVNDRHYQRMQKNLDDALEHAEQVITINPADEDFANNPLQKVAPTLIINPDDNAICMQDEIFGPLLPIKTYESFEDTINYINDRPRPLAAYYFGYDKAEEKRFLTGTTSGGACVNDVMFHMLQKDLPFGGVGPSGMGAYHGIEGLKRSAMQKAFIASPKRSQSQNLQASCHPTATHPRKASSKK